MIFNRLFTLCLVLICTTALFAAKPAYQIKIKIKDFKGDKLVLGYHFSDKQYVKDTAILDKKGFFVLEGDKPLDGGMYMAIMPPSNQYFEFLVTADNQRFTLETSGPNYVDNMKVSNSDENKVFYEYSRFMAESHKKRKEIEDAFKKIEGNSKKEEKEKDKLKEQMKEAGDAVDKFQRSLIEKNPKSFTAAMVRAMREIDIPEPPKNDKGEIDSTFRFKYYKIHYFDNIDFTDSRLLRTPILHGRVDKYLGKSITPQIPDSVAAAVDFILEKASVNEEAFKFFLIRYLNQYARSKIVCMDAVYVHIVENYYMKDKAPWTNEETMKKIVDNAMTLKPLLCEKIAPNIKMQMLDVEGTLENEKNESEHKRFKVGKTISLHDVPSDYTVLFFWSPDCGHCKKAMPKMLDFYEEYKPKGVEIFATCIKSYKNLPECAKMIKEKKMGVWMNMVDPYYRSRFRQIYDAKTTPIIYILDKNKKILAKRIGTEQLPEVMDQIIKRDNQKLQESIKD